MPDTNMRILSVDDFSTMRRIIKNLLKQLGYHNVLEADDGTAALEMLRRQKIDLVISDWNMPKMTGIELLKAIRADESLKQIPLLMVTAEAQRENVIEAAKAGANNYIVKPFTSETLKDKIDKIFGS